MPRKERHAVPDPQGGWIVEKLHADRASAHCVLINRILSIAASL